MGEVPTAPGFPSMGVYPQSASISNDGISPGKNHPAMKVPPLLETLKLVSPTNTSSITIITNHPNDI